MTESIIVKYSHLTHFNVCHVGSIGNAIRVNNVLAGGANTSWHGASMTTLSPVKCPVYKFLAQPSGK